MKEEENIYDYDDTPDCGQDIDEWETEDEDDENDPEFPATLKKPPRL